MITQIRTFAPSPSPYHTEFKPTDERNYKEIAYCQTQEGYLLPNLTIPLARPLTSESLIANKATRGAAPTFNQIGGYAIIRL